LAEVLDQEISHDQVTRFLSEREYTSQDLWRNVNQSTPAGLGGAEKPAGCVTSVTLLA
jgi:hypothetical protein